MIGAAAVGALFLVGLVLSVRLLLLWGRSRQAPPLLVGIALVLIGPVALTLAVLAVRFATQKPELSHALGSGAAIASTAGIACTALVTAVVFRQGSRIGWIATGLLIAAMSLCVLATVLQGGVDLRRPPTGFRLGYQTLQLGTLLWASVEALVTWQLLHRRLRAGLADPLVVNRIGLWSLATMAAATGIAIGFFATIFGLHYALTVVELTISAMGLVAVGAVWLAFMPPDRYRRAVLARHAPPGGASHEHASGRRWPH